MIHFLRNVSRLEDVWGFFGVVDFEQGWQNLGLEGRNATGFADQPGGQLVPTCLVKILFLSGKTRWMVHKDRVPTPLF